MARPERYTVNGEGKPNRVATTVSLVRCCDDSDIDAGRLRTADTLDRPSRVHKTADLLPLPSAAIGADEQPYAELRLELRDGLRNGRLSDLYPAGTRENEPVSITLMNVSIAVNLSIRSMPRARCP